MFAYLKVALGSAVLVGALVLAGMIGMARNGPDTLCPSEYHLDGTWEPIGWKIENGYPRTDCEMHSDKIAFEDGTWVWK